MKPTLLFSLLVIIFFSQACGSATSIPATVLAQTAMTSVTTLAATMAPVAPTTAPLPTVDPNMPEGATGKDAQGYYMDANGVRYYSEELQIGSETSQIWYKTQMKNGPIMLYDGQISLYGGSNSIPIDIRSEKDLPIAQQLGLLSHTTNMADYPTISSRLFSPAESVLLTLWDRLYPGDQHTKDNFNKLVDNFLSPTSVTLEVQIPDNATDPHSTYTSFTWNPALDGYRENLVNWNQLDPKKDPSIDEFSYPFPMRIKFNHDGTTLVATVATTNTQLTEREKDVLVFAPYYMGLIMGKLPTVNGNPDKNSLYGIPTPSGRMDMVSAPAQMSSIPGIVPFIKFEN